MSHNPQSTAPMHSLRNGDLFVHFQWCDDRFRHQVFFDDKLLLTSEEGNSIEPWPASPPIQQLSLETINQSDVLLGVGAAGLAHWSISVERRDQGFFFDCACQTKSPPTWIGTTYQRLVEGIEIISDFECNVDSTRIAITPNGLQGSPLRWSYQIKK